ncbi:TerB family tellurite resistance protein [Photobacterium atrarenae]|uniref:TerB family tellurite resistance protein n=1 Tax=Photobacterium atrarenae TaxID=865757 RepID=A0ABY5GK33_9GAMM|nr:TerB family tellurite resistance protein [Photobacterium atrarenae]UTV29064.1 TerB family tellurite resistance protein [Photobacterium atrarenae]
MFRQLRTLLRQVMHEGEDSGAVDTPSLQLAMAALLCEVSAADHQVDPKEQSAKVHLLTRLLDMGEEEATFLIEKASTNRLQSVSLYEFTNKLRSLMPEQRYQLIEAMWQVAYADGFIDPLEEAVIRQVAELIYVSHSDFIRAKLSAQPS